MANVFQGAGKSAYVPNLPSIPTSTDPAPPTQVVGADGSKPTTTSLSVGAYTPDYGGILASDPTMTAAQNNYTTGQSQDYAALMGGIQRALIQAGGLGNMDFSKFGMTDPKTGKSFLDEAMADGSVSNLAGQNDAAGTSTFGQLKQAHDQNLKNLMAAMAARGLGGSGQQNLELTNEGQQYASSTDKAANDLYNALSGMQSGYASNEQNRQQSLVNTQTQQLANIEANPLYAPVAGTAAKYVPGKVVDGGGYVYQDANGNYWVSQNADGSSATAVPSSKVSQVSTPVPGVTTGGGLGPDVPTTKKSTTAKLPYLGRH